MCRYTTIGEMFHVLKNYSFSREIESDVATKYRHIHYGDIHTKFNNQITNDTFVPYLKACAKINAENSIIKGDVVMVDASEDYNMLGKTVYIKDTPAITTVSGSHTFHLRPCQDYDGLYFTYFTESEPFKRQMLKVGTGLSVISIYKAGLEKVLIPNTDYKLQVKYGKLLSSLDTLLELLDN